MPYVEYTIHNVDGRKVVKFTSRKVSLAEITAAVAIEFPGVDPITLDVSTDTHGGDSSLTDYDEEVSLCVSQ